MMDDGEIRPPAIRAPWASQCVTSAQWVLETEIFGQIAEQFCGPPHSQMKSFQHLISTRPQFKRQNTANWHKTLWSSFHAAKIPGTTQLVWFGWCPLSFACVDLFFSLTFCFLDPEDEQKDQNENNIRFWFLVRHLGAVWTLGTFVFFFCNILQLSNDSNDWSRSCHFHGSPGTVGGGTHGARAAGGLVLVLVLSSAPVALIWSCL